MAAHPPIDEAALRDLVREAVAEALNDAREPVPGERRHAIKALNPKAIDRIVRSTPSRVVQGRTGTRYLTDVYVGLRADHAIALDAVNSEIPEGFADEQGWLALHSQCQTHEEFLLYPDHGRRLDEPSRARLEKEGDHGVDIQVIAGDGLSAFALAQNGPPLVAALQRELPSAGFRVGKPVFVKYARVGVQDHVGVILGAKATVMIVGERPGLGTGDSLSIYTAFGPKLNQDNSEKDCISNIRALGLSPELAAKLCAELMRRTFEAGGGGVKLL